MRCDAMRWHSSPPIRGSLFIVVILIDLFLFLALHSHSHLHSHLHLFFFFFRSFVPSQVPWEAEHRNAGVRDGAAAAEGSYKPRLPALSAQHWPQRRQQPQRPQRRRLPPHQRHGARLRQLCRLGARSSHAGPMQALSEMNMKTTKLFTSIRTVDQKKKKKKKENQARKYCSQLITKERSARARVLCPREQRTARRRTQSQERPRSGGVGGRGLRKRE
jgi:hypothetical protein